MSMFMALLLLGLTNPRDHHTENSPPSKRTLVYETNRYIPTVFVPAQGHPMGNFEKKT